MKRSRLALRTALLFASTLVLGCATGGPRTVEVETFSKQSIQTHLVRSGDNAFLVDPGYEKSGKAIERRIRRTGFDPAKLSAVVLTHGHADHVGAAKWFKDKYNIPVIIGGGDDKELAAGKSTGELCPVGGIAKTRVKRDQAKTFTPFAADVVINGKRDLAELTEIAGSIDLFGGHTKGSLVIVAGTDAFVGDLFRGEILGVGAREHFYICDETQNLRDIMRVLEEYPEVERFHVGHFGSVTRIELVRWLNGYG